METKRSTHKVEIVPIELKPHPNADSLSVVEVFGYTVCVRTEDWKGQTLGAYIPPDSVCPDTAEFDFLGTNRRIKAKRLRGVMSFGMLFPAPDGAKIGDDVAEQLGVTHYEPPLVGLGKGGASNKGEVAPAPDVMAPKYDLDAFQRYAKQCFTDGEDVFVTEKIDGANGRFVFSDGKMHCGSRQLWKKEFPSPPNLEDLVKRFKGDEERAKEIFDKISKSKENQKKNMWWAVLDSTPTLREFCEAHPDHVVFGEVYGHVQKLTYGHKPGTCSFVAFDIMYKGNYLNPIEARLLAPDIPWVPDMGTHEYDFEKLSALAEGRTLIEGADHIREGIVVSPLQERWHDRVGRVKLKLVSGTYLEKKR